MPASRLPAVALAALSLMAAGCGGGDDTSTLSTGASGATGASATENVAADAEAKATAIMAQTALEVYAIDNAGSYAGVDVATLVKIEPKLDGADLTVTGDRSTYTLEVTSSSGVVFTLTRAGNGAEKRTCEPPGTGGCPAGGDWS